MQLITDVLRKIRRGAAVRIASEQLAEVVRAVDATGKAGSVTIVIKKIITADVKVKKPHEAIPTAVFFSDEHGDLHRQDPKQQELFEDVSERSAGRA